jgi:hypothetical protein
VRRRWRTPTRAMTAPPSTKANATSAKAVEAFRDNNGAVEVRVPKAAAEITDNLGVLLTFYGYRAEHWIHLSRQPGRVHLRHRQTGTASHQGSKLPAPLAMAVGVLAWRCSSFIKSAKHAGEAREGSPLAARSAPACPLRERHPYRTTRRTRRRCSSRVTHTPIPSVLAVSAAATANCVTALRRGSMRLLVRELVDRCMFRLSISSGGADGRAGVPSPVGIPAHPAPLWATNAPRESRG